MGLRYSARGHPRIPHLYLKHLLSPLLEQHGMVPLIKENLRLLQQDITFYVRYYVDYPERLYSDVALALYPVFQEELTNIRRHAPKTRTVVVSLTYTHHTVSLQVQDDGPGLNAEAAAAEQGFRVSGINSMRRRRAEAVGGSLELTSVPGHGTRVVLRIP
jgi:signal transduction histidine kinase